MSDYDLDETIEYLENLEKEFPKQGRYQEAHLMGNAVYHLEKLQEDIAQAQALIYSYPPSAPFTEDGVTWKQEAEELREKLTEARETIELRDNQIQEMIHKAAQNHLSGYTQEYTDER